MAQDERKAELTAELARSRAQITVNVQGLRRDLDFPARARRAFSRHPAIWIGGAVLLGLSIARLPVRRKMEVPAPRKKGGPAAEKAAQAGLLLGALKIVFDVARPTLIRFATRRVADWFESANRGRAERR